MMLIIVLKVLKIFCFKVFCIFGYNLNFSGVCVLCMIGLYKDVRGNGNCIVCLLNFIILLMGFI